MVSLGKRLGIIVLLSTSLLVLTLFLLQGPAQALPAAGDIQTQQLIHSVAAEEGKNAVGERARGSISLVQHAQPAKAKPGHPMAITLRMNNPGPLPLTDVVVRDILPPDLLYVSASADGRYDAERESITWDLGTLEVGDEAQVTFQALVKKGLAARMPNLAEVTAAELSGRAVSVEELGVPSPGLARSRSLALMATQIHTVSAGGSIQAAIDAANPGDTIRVESGTFNESLAIAKSLTLEGGYDASFASRAPRTTIIDASSRAISITGSMIHVTVDGFEIKNGDAGPENGGGILVDVEYDSYVVIHDNFIHDNAAEAGGAIWADLDVRSELEITDNDVMTNTAVVGAGIWADVYLSSTLTLVGNEIGSNEAIRGGGFYARIQYFGTFSVDDNTVRDNTASMDQGGLYLYAQYNTHGTFDSNQVVGNRADGDDGGAKVELDDNATTTFNDNVFRDNGAVSSNGGLHLDLNQNGRAVGDRLTLVDNTAGGDNGGARVYLHEGCAFTMTESISVTGNQAGSAHGGIFIHAGYSRSSTPNMVVFNNRALNGSGGGFYFSTGDAGGIFHAPNATVISNTSSSDGGGGYVSVDDGSFADLSGSRFERNHSGGFGGGLRNPTHNEGTTLLLNYAQFLSNTADGDGGGASLNGAEEGSRLEVTHSIFRNNQADGNGGAVQVGDRLVESGGVALFNDNQIISNTAGSQGGGFYVSSDLAYEGGIAEFNRNWIEGNRSGGNGGGVRMNDAADSAVAQIISNTIINNLAVDGHGGGIYIYDIAYYGSRTEFRDNLIAGNVISSTDSYHGGGIRIYGMGDGDTAWMTGNVISGNVATGKGGGLFWDDDIDFGSKLYFRDNDLLNNRAEEGGGCYFDYDWEDGGPVFFTGNRVNENVAWGDYGGCHFDDVDEGTTAFIKDNEFNGNTAAGDYGGVHLGRLDDGAVVEFWNNQIVGNRAGVSGTVSLGGQIGGIGVGEIEDGALLDFRNNQVLTNTASVTGSHGGMVVHLERGGKLLMEETTIAGNAAGDSFGGVSVVMTPTAWLEMNQNVIRANTAVTEGGGVHIFGGGNSLYFLRRNQIVDNSAGSKGGLWIEDGDGTLWGVTENNIIAGNQGSGVHLVDADLRSTNDTIADNFEYGIMMTGTVTSTAYLSNTIIWGHTWSFTRTPVVAYTDRFTMVATTSDIEGGWPGSGNLNADPSFVGGGDYHLQSGSPCEDQGATVPLAIDIDGDARSQGAGYDIGADEIASGLESGLGSHHARAVLMATTAHQVSAGGSIQAAIDGANPGDTIQVQSGTFTESLVITKSLTLEGGYDSAFTTRTPRTTVISPNSRAISITGSAVQVTVDGFEIKNGDAGVENGGGILVDVDTDSRVVIHDNFIHHNTGWEGGGIWADLDVRSDLGITDNDVMTNAAGYGGGGIWAEVSLSGTLALEGNQIVSNTAATLHGGFDARVRTFGRFSVDDNTVMSNTSDLGNGGLSLWAQYNTHGSFNRNQIIGNRAQDSIGGAAIQLEDNATTTLNDDVFQGNAAGGDTGGLELDLDANARVVGNRLILADNTAGGNNGGAWVDLREGCAFTMTEGISVTGNQAGEGRGGIYIRAGYSRSWTPNIAVFDNRALNGSGGGFYFSSYDAGGIFHAPNATVISNTARGGDGGGGYISVDDGSFADLSGSRFERNHSGSSGGGLYNGSHDEGSMLLLNHTRFLSNTASSLGGGARLHGADEASRLEVTHSTFRNNQAGGSGGAVYVSYHLVEDGGAALFSDNDIISNTAGGRGGGVCLSNDMAYEGGAAAFNRNWIEGNRSGGDGGGVRMADAADSSVVQIIGNTIINNVAVDGHGGGIRMADIAYYGSRTEFRDNVISGNVISSTSSYDGGGIRISGMGDGDTAWMTGNVISGNVATGKGGGLFWDDFIDYASRLTFEDNELLNNEAVEGGGCYFDGDWGDGGPISFSRNRVNGNVAWADYGGCTFDDIDEGTRAFINDNQFNDNTAAGNYGGVHLGQLDDGAVIEFRSNEIVGNRAGFSGSMPVGGHYGGMGVGPIEDGALLDFHGNALLSNTASVAGTVGGAAGNLDPGGQLLIDESSIAGNTAGESFGGLKVEMSSMAWLEMNHNVIRANTAVTEGGGVTIYGGGNSQYFLRRNQVVSNSAGSKGGLWIEDGDGTLWGITENNIIAGNQGSGVHLVDADLHSTNDTIADNFEYGIMMTGTVTSTAYLSNTIIWGHTWSFTRTPILAYTDRFTMVATTSDIEGGWPGAGNFDSDPLFVGGGDYHLTEPSPCIDAGATVPLTVDFELDPRPIHTAYDVGADEFAGALSERVGQATDAGGTPTDVFGEDGNVYATGTAFPVNSDVDVYIVPDTDWTDGMLIPGDVSGDGVNTLTTDAAGNPGPALIWGAPLSPGAYDVVFDVNQNGTYDAGIDVVDDAAVAGFRVMERVPVGGVTSPYAALHGIVGSLVAGAALFTAVLGTAALVKRRRT